VAFGEHRIMLRPGTAHDLRVRSSRLRIVPEADVTALDPRRVSATASRSRPSTSAPKPCVRQHRRRRAQSGEEFALTPDDPAYFYPFLYDNEEFPDLVQFIRPQYSDPKRRTFRMARNFLDAEGPTPTFNILSGMTYGIRRNFHLPQAA